MKPQGLNRELEKQIVDKILGEGYDKRIRPSGFNNKTKKNGKLSGNCFQFDVTFVVCMFNQHFFKNISRFRWASSR